MCRKRGQFSGVSEELSLDGRAGKYYFEKSRPIGIRYTHSVDTNCFGVDIQLVHDVVDGLIVVSTSGR